MEDSYNLNAHNKEEFPPAHTAEHLLNQTMVRMFGCERSTNAHIERKKSKISYKLDHKPDRRDEKEIERRMKTAVVELKRSGEFDFCIKSTTKADDLEALRTIYDALKS